MEMENDGNVLIQVLRQNLVLPATRRNIQKKCNHTEKFSLKFIRERKTSFGTAPLETFPALW
jgi:hypothetical protein